MRLTHNLEALNIFRTQSRVFQKQNSALNRINTGSKVNSAKDNPNILASSEKMRMQIRGLQMASRNVQDGVSMLQTAEGGLNGISEMYNRIRELAVKGLNGTNTSSDKDINANEIYSLAEGIKDTAENTEFNGVKLLNNTDVLDNKNPKIIPMTSGADVGEKVDIPSYNIASTSLKFYSLDAGGNIDKSKYFTVGLKDINFNVDGGIDFKSVKMYDSNTNTEVTPAPTVDDYKNAIKAANNGEELSSLTLIDKLSEEAVSIRSKYGALENRFESGLVNLNEMADRIEGADSNIRDADVATEIMEYSKDNILVDAGNAMMAQANKFPQDILKILQNVR